MHFWSVQSLVHGRMRCSALCCGSGLVGLTASLGERGVCACKPTPYAAHRACPTYGATYALAERTTARCRLASTQLVNGFSMAAPSRIFPAEIRPAFYRTAELRGPYTHTHTRTHIQEASHSDAAVISTRRWSAFVVAGSISSRQPTVQCIVERQAPELPTLSIIFLLPSPLPPFLSLNACCLSPPITKTLDVHAAVSGQRRTHERGRRAEERRSTGVCRLITFRVASEKGVHNTHSHRCCLWWTSPLVRWCTAHRFSSEHQSVHAFFRAITLTSCHSEQGCAEGFLLATYSRAACWRRCRSVLRVRSAAPQVK